MHTDSEETIIVAIILNSFLSTSATLSPDDDKSIMLSIHGFAVESLHGGPMFDINGCKQL